jgi:hypothetical protein
LGELSADQQGQFVDTLLTIKTNLSRPEVGGNGSRKAKR